VDCRARDVLSLLVRANTVADHGPRQCLSDKDILARNYFSVLPSPFSSTNFVEIPTFLVAGHETTSTVLSWALYELSLSSALQASLREE
jgi:hypothetical protein